MKTRYRSVASLFASVLIAMLITVPAQAQEEKEFAEHKFVLQISDMDPAKQTIVLNVANNIMKHYGPDNAEVEIVAFGPGLRLLFEENANSGRIQGLVDGSGVRFAACNNTITSMTKTLGHSFPLNANATVVPAGVVRIKELVDEGYLLVKP